jgi:hypothetical protein
MENFLLEVIHQQLQGTRLEIGGFFVVPVYAVIYARKPREPYVARDS